MQCTININAVEGTEEVTSAGERVVLVGAFGWLKVGAFKYG